MSIFESENKVVQYFKDKLVRVVYGKYEYIKLI